MSFEGLVSQSPGRERQVVAQCDDGGNGWEGGGVLGRVFSDS